MEKTNTEYINHVIGNPDESCLARYRTNEENRKALFRMSAKHFIAANRLNEWILCHRRKNLILDSGKE